MCFDKQLSLALYRTNVDLSHDSVLPQGVNAERVIYRAARVYRSRIGSELERAGNETRVGQDVARGIKTDNGPIEKVVLECSAG